MRGNRCIGLLREVKSTWERRVAVAPLQVKQLVDKGIRVLVQPCERRVFKDSEFEEAGAEITNDLEEACVLLGVKEFPSSNLYPNHKHLMFSHTIKGQPNNMAFLQACLDKNVQLIDYECIREPGVGGPRLVAFGRFAGLAGMITGFRGLGEYLLARNASTPFLYMSSSYMYPSLDDANQSVDRIADQIRKFGLPRAFGPLVFTFTGYGNVTKGAVELFEHLPVEWVSPADLPNLHKNFDNHKVYGCMAPLECIVQPVDPSRSMSKADYYDNPNEYRPVFHETLAPYTSVLVNGYYWDQAYPRLLTCEQMLQLRMQNENAVMAVFDITCDIEGSIEFLRKPTDTATPYFTYDPITDEVYDRIDGDGVLVLGVDALPAELPREASQHFSNVLTPFIEPLASSDGTLAFIEEKENLPPEIARAVITSGGELTRDFRYLNQYLRNVQKKSPLEVKSTQPQISKLILLDGHLFDSNLINSILDNIEESRAEFDIVSLQSGVNHRELQRVTRLVLQITATQAKMNVILKELRQLVDATPKAQAIMFELPFGAVKSDKGMGGHVDFEFQRPTGREKQVLVLGSGFVSKPVVDYLSKVGPNMVTVATNDLRSARRICEHNPLAKPMLFDAPNLDELESLIYGADVVVSLLPATMHIPVAEKCVELGKHLITASYISDGMKALDKKAREAGVCLVNEVGLDPGLDHMSALEIIRDAKAAGEEIISFSSLCGGLPAPEAANNPLRYKFSWSPMGVLSASQNSARYLKGGHIVEIDGGDLLRHAEPMEPNPFPTMNLEVLPNRNSMAYMGPYEIPNVESMFRGTIRYAGFSKIMYGLKTLGLMQNNVSLLANMSWYEAMSKLLDGSSSPIESAMNRLKDDGYSDHDAKEVVEAAEWLDLFSRESCVENESPVVEAFCSQLESKLAFAPSEKDLVIMHHRIMTQPPASSKSKLYTSSPLLRGDDKYSAMARSVGIPVAIVAQMALDGELSSVTGVVSGGDELISKKVMKESKKNGINFVEEVDGLVLI